MEREQYQQIALGAAALGIIAAIAPGRLPQWLRVTLVIGLTLVAGGAGLFVYRYATHPTTLTIAAGSSDGEAVRLMSKIATRLSSANAPVRLKVLDKGDALDAVKAFSAGQAKLAVVRADIGDLSTAETVVVIKRSVVLIVIPPDGSIKGWDDLKGKTIGVIGGEINHRVVEALTAEYGLESAHTIFRDLKWADVPPALKSKQVDALLVVMPITDKYLTMLRSLLPGAGKQQMRLLPIGSAAAIANVTRYYQSYDLPKGTVLGSPPIPDDDMKTLHVPFYLVANKTLSDDVVGALAKAIMDARRDLIGE